MRNFITLPAFLFIGFAMMIWTDCNCETTKASKVVQDKKTNISLWPEIDARKPDPAIEKRINKLLATMSLDRKIGQMIMIEIGSFTPEDMKKYRFGAVFNGGGSWPHKNEFANAKEWVALSDSIWQSCIEGLNDPIPPLWGTDAVHGHNNFAGATIFPHNIGLGATHDTALIYRIGQVTAKEVLATGINWDFAPTVAVVQDDRWGRTYESYSEMPDIVASCARNYIAGLQGKLGEESILATAKHFIGDGGTVNGDDQGNNISSEEKLISIHAAGYIAALKAGAMTVMASFSSWQGERMHAHKYLLTDVLKKRLGFDGFVVSDYDGIGTIEGCSKSNCPNAVNAGIDMIMIPLKKDWEQFFDHLKREVESGEVPMSRIDDAVSRILRVKLRMGLPDQKKPGDRIVVKNIQQPGAPENRAVAREAVRKSLVLLKNKDHLLPIDRNARILVTGRGADTIALQMGGWTLTWQGNENNNADYRNATSILSGIKTVAKNVTYDPVCNKIQKNMYDIAIVVIGERPYSEYKGDIEGGMTMEHANNYSEDIALLQKIKGAQIPVVTIFLSGRPLCVNKELNSSNAFVAAWLPGSEGAGITDVLFKSADGKVANDFSGKLTFSWPKRPCQTSVNRGDKDYDPLFPTGYGLTYAGKDTGIDTVPEYTNDGYGCNGTLTTAKADSVMVIYNGKFTGNDGAWMGGPDNWSGQPGNPDAHISTLDVTLTADSKNDNRNALHFNFTGPAYWGIGGNERNLSGYFTADYKLAFDVFVNAKPQGNVSIAMICNYPCQGESDITSILRDLPAGKWEKIRIPLENFKSADFFKINSPFQISTTGAADFLVANIRLEK